MNVTREPSPLRIELTPEEAKELLSWLGFQDPDYSTVAGELYRVLYNETYPLQDSDD